jgi:hypothetical protein
MLAAHLCLLGDAPRLRVLALGRLRLVFAVVALSADLEVERGVGTRHERVQLVHLVDDLVLQ